MKTIYLVMVDLDGTMRSGDDTPKAAFPTRELAEEFIKLNTYLHGTCGGYSASVKKVPFKENNDEIL